MLSQCCIQISTLLRKWERRVYWLVGIGMVAVVVVTTCWPLIVDLLKSLSVYDGDRFHSVIVESSLNYSKVPSIPNIIHFILPSNNVSVEISNAHATCLSFAGDFEILNWDENQMKNFISSHYSWFLDTYNSYSYPVQRVDAFKYFVLYHFGGIYLDIDIGCRMKLNKLLLTNYEGLLPVTEPFGVSNDVLIFSPHHPLLKLVLDRLALYSTDFLFSPYLAVMWSTGPLFLSVAVYDYSYQQPSPESVGLLSFRDYTSRFFYHLSPSSSTSSHWHQWDAPILLTLYEYFYPLCFLLICATFFTCLILGPKSASRSIKNRKMFASSTSSNEHSKKVLLSSLVASESQQWVDMYDRRHLLSSSSVSMASPMAPSNITKRIPPQVDSMLHMMRESDRSKDDEYHLGMRMRLKSQPQDVVVSSYYPSFLPGDKSDTSSSSSSSSSNYSSDHNYDEDEDDDVDNDNVDQIQNELDHDWRDLERNCR